MSLIQLVVQQLLMKKLKLTLVLNLTKCARGSKLSLIKKQSRIANLKYSCNNLKTLKVSNLNQFKNH